MERMERRTTTVNVGRELKQGQSLSTLAKRRETSLFSSLGEAVELGKRHSRRVVATVALGGAVALVACKGGDNSGGEVNPSPTQPSETPIPAETIKPTPTPSPVVEITPTPTPAPEPTPEPTPEPAPAAEVWSDEEIAAKLYSVVDLANQVADAYPESELLSTLKDDTQTAFADFKQILKTKDYSSIHTPLNDFGNIGSYIGQFACFATEGEGEPEGQAWVAIKDLVLKVSLKYEKLGYIEETTTQAFKEIFFTVHEGCTNPTILSSNN